MSSPPQFFSSSVSLPDKVFFPPTNWKSTKNYEVEQDIGPGVKHIYEVSGPRRPRQETSLFFLRLS